jgi:hypothetical protein
MASEVGHWKWGLWVEKNSSHEEHRAVVVDIEDWVLEWVAG